MGLADFFDAILNGINLRVRGPQGIGGILSQSLGQPKH